MRDTKERILTEALRLFAEGGYEATSVSDIAAALGITKGALYRHYDSKRAILNGILARMETRDAEQARACSLPEGTMQETEQAYGDVSADSVVAFSKAMFRYWTQDAFAARFRRMLTVEQFRSGEMSRLYQQYLVSGPVGYLTDLFAALHVERPREEAARFYAPMFLLYSICDGTEDREEAAAFADGLLEDAGERLKGFEN